MQRLPLSGRRKVVMPAWFPMYGNVRERRGNMGTSSSPRFERRWLVVFCSVLFCLLCFALLCFVLSSPLAHNSSSRNRSRLTSLCLSLLCSLSLARPPSLLFSELGENEEGSGLQLGANELGVQTSSHKYELLRQPICDFWIWIFLSLWVWLSCVAVPDVCGNRLRNWLRWQVVRTARMISRARRITRIMSARTWCGRSIIGAL
jgi:hypothetical protein